MKAQKVKYLHKKSRSQIIAELERANDPGDDPLLFALRQMSDKQFQIIQWGITESILDDMREERHKW